VKLGSKPAYTSPDPSTEPISLKVTESPQSPSQTSFTWTWIGWSHSCSPGAANTPKGGKWRKAISCKTINRLDFTSFYQPTLTTPSHILKSETEYQIFFFFWFWGGHSQSLGMVTSTLQILLQPSKHHTTSYRNHCTVIETHHTKEPLHLFPRKGAPTLPCTASSLTRMDSYSLQQPTGLWIFWFQ
jgi:hypothetical protein